ncbi:catalase/peroxidase HPI [Mesohalobacter halotolerans]|uniref:Catalase-peroxidase n=1 Tax=Mesohalobacter halotolerans TaxID=1883405 RepID=A0A4U5TQE8_9FLAO|nr:catalase/peroxidase HPI [Mesohalobacter halotolerans]TKS56256.1 catalase/peroxidase HPI [Mesohalobacter halotolerans]
MKFKILLVFITIVISSCSNKNNDMLGENSESEGGCPFGFDKMTASTNDVEKKTGSKDFWPNKLDLDVLRQNSGMSDPMGQEFNYREEFSKLDYEALKNDIEKVMTDSKDWWPADFGNYGGLFIRMAWHSAGTYRTGDGRGGSRAGQQRFAPINSWPDNANLDKSRRLLWPVKQKYGNQISWADLMILAGNVAYESMGFETIGFSGGRVDVWEPASDVYWGSETEWLANNKRYDEEGNLEKPLAAVQMGLIYVNPEGPNGNPDPKLAAHNIRETFGRMGMNDEETVALIAGGHTLGKTHGAAPGKYLGKNPEASNIEKQGFGWESTYKSGKGPDAITSGLEVTWTLTPTQWNHGYFKSLFENEWELVKSPGGAHQFQAVNPEKMYPDAFDDSKSHKPTMLVTDLSMIEDPAYRKISKRFYENPEEFEEAFAKAWFKLTHRDMGPKSTYIGPEVPQEEFIWQDPIPEVDYNLITNSDVEKLKAQILKTNFSIGDLVKTAWASASTYRDSDRKGGANGGRIRLEPQVNWESNKPAQLQDILKVYKQIQTEFNSKSGSKKVSMADLIVLGGNAAIEKAAEKAGYDITVPFNPGRADASQEQTDIEGMAVLEPMADGFRNYMKTDYTLSPEQLLVDKSQLLTLTPPEMTVLVGGMRALDANYDDSNLGILTNTPGTLDNSFFKNLLSMEYEWKPKTPKRKYFDGFERGTDNKKWTASRVDLIFGSNSELRALAEVYAADNAKEKFINDFVKAWSKVMNLDRFDLKYNQ